MIPLADWLQTLGQSALGTLWLPLMAWTVVAMVLLGVLRVWRSAHTYVHYAARAALMLALPLGLILATATDFSLLSLLPSPAVEAPGNVVFVLPPLDLSPASASAPVFHWNWYHGLGLLTLLAGLLAVVRLSALAGHARALYIFRKHLPAQSTASLQSVIDELADTLAVRRRVRAIATTQPVVPMTLGWRRPVVVVPAALLDDADQLHMALLHEMIHIRRRDALMQGIEQVVSALFVINPAVWLLRRSIATYREMICDAEVITQPRVSSKRYAALLYSFATPRVFPRQLTLSMASSEKQLKKRILAMKSFRTSDFRYVDPKIISLVLAGLLLSAASLVVACTDLVDANVDTAEEQLELGKVNPDAEVFVVVDEMPELIGGLAAIQQELTYPETAKAEGLQGRVIVQFIINEAGLVTEPAVVRGISPELDEEAVRALQLARFKPGKQDGVVVPVKMSIPITFKLSDEDELWSAADPRPRMIPLAIKRSESKITGVILSSETREGIAGANVFLKGTTLGAATDQDGRFTLLTLGQEVENPILMVSHISYQRPLEISLGSDEDIKERTREAATAAFLESLSSQFETKLQNESDPEKKAELQRFFVALQQHIEESKNNQRLSPGFIEQVDEAWHELDLKEFMDKARDEITGKVHNLYTPNGIAPGTVRVTSSGTVLQENVDYTVDYEAGTVTILNAAYIKPNQPLNITYDPK